MKFGCPSPIFWNIYRGDITLTITITTRGETTEAFLQMDEEVDNTEENKIGDVKWRECDGTYFCDNSLGYVICYLLHIIICKGEMKSGSSRLANQD